MHFPSTCDTDTDDLSSTATADHLDAPPLLFSSLDYAEIPGQAERHAGFRIVALQACPRGR